VSAPTRAAGLLAGISAIAAALGTPACVFREVEACFPVLSLGDRVELELVDEYVEGGPYLWSIAGSVAGAPSCEARDDLAVGRYPFVVSGSSGGSGCLAYGAIPERGLWDLDFSDIRVGPAFLSTQTHLGGGGYWQLVVLRDSREPDPFGEEATPGQHPPLVARRTISDPTSACADAWVAEIRRLDPPSTDGGAGDGGT